MVTSGDARVTVHFDLAVRTIKFLRAFAVPVFPSLSAVSPCYWARGRDLERARVFENGMLCCQGEVLLQQNSGQPKSVDEGNRALTIFVSLIDGGLREVAGGDDGSLGEWSQASTQFGNLFAPDRMQPALRLHLD